MNKLFIWKQKSEGKKWLKMKECTESSAKKWLAIYKKSDPFWTYVVSEKEPKQ